MDLGVGGSRTKLKSVSPSLHHKPLQLSSRKISMQGYPEGYWPQPTYSLSQKGFGDDVSGEVQHHAGLAEYDMQMYPADQYEQNGADGNSKSCPVRCGREG